MVKEEKKDYGIYWVVAIYLLIAFGLYAVHTARSEGTQCMVNPIQYAVEHIGINTCTCDPAVPSCTCVPVDPRYKPYVTELNKSYPI